MDMSWIIIECMPSSSEHILCIKPSNFGCILWISMLKIHVKWPSQHHFYSLSRPTSTWDPGPSRGSESADTSRWLGMGVEVQFEYETAKTIALIDTLIHFAMLRTSYFFFIKTNGCSIFTCYGLDLAPGIHVVCAANHGPWKHRLVCTASAIYTPINSQMESNAQICKTTLLYMFQAHSTEHQFNIHQHPIDPIDPIHPWNCRTQIP